jgi:hypothetical protein
VFSRTPLAAGCLRGHDRVYNFAQTCANCRPCSSRYRFHKRVTVYSFSDLAPEDATRRYGNLSATQDVFLQINGREKSFMAYVRVLEREREQRVMSFAMSSVVERQTESLSREAEGASRCLLLHVIVVEKARDGEKASGQKVRHRQETDIEGEQSP